MEVLTHTCRCEVRCCLGDTSWYEQREPSHIESIETNTYEELLNFAKQVGEWVGKGHPEDSVERDMAEQAFARFYQGFVLLSKSREEFETFMNQKLNNLREACKTACFFNKGWEAT